MIISHKYKFIFIKTEKTAGTSIEIALSKFCGEDDIITPVSAADEHIRRNLGHRGPQNYLPPLSDYGLRDYVNLVLYRVKKARYYNHIPAAEIKDYVGDNVWNTYYKFCFERNPWDRLISLYYYKNRSEPRPTISEFLESGIPNILKRRGFQCYTINGEVVVDKVCLFENLKEEIESIRVHLGLPERIKLPRAKSSFRKDKQSYREILGEDEIDKIRELFRDEIALFGYVY
jgi:hypothetical protein